MRPSRPFPSLSPAAVHGVPPLDLWGGLILRDPPDLRRCRERIDTLRDRWRRYLSLYPFGLWAPGLVVTADMHRLTDLLFPLPEVLSTVRFVVSQLTSSPIDGFGLVASGASSWLTVVQRLGVDDPAPSRLLSPAIGSPDSAARFLSRWYLPARHGCSFGRYPRQLRYVTGLLEQWRGEGRGELSLLDAACGTGEGVWDLVCAARDAGWNPGEVRITGETLSAVEVLTAATGTFIHDPARTERVAAVRQLLSPWVRGGGIRFRRHDLLEEGGEGERFHLIVCNGLLAGPSLSGTERAALLVGRLCTRLLPGGVLLVADRFHDGWRRSMGRGTVAEILRRNGLEPFDPGEGIGGVRGGG